MDRQTRWVLVLLLSWTTFMSGCCMPSRQYEFCNNREKAFYQGVATNLEQPDVNSCRLEEVRCAGRPITLDNFQQCEFWDLKLEQLVCMAMGNSKIIRRISVAGATKGTTVAVPQIDLDGGTGGLLSTPESVATVYDPAVQETTVNALNRGVEDALSDFDAQLNASLFWEKNDRPINVNPANANAINIFNPNFKQDLGTFQAELSKTAATGTRLFARNNVIYDHNNNPSRQTPQDYNMNFELGLTQPLLRGNGTLFNRIAGPNSSIGVYNGVAIARIHQDITLADFECNVRNMVFDLEKAYWELLFAYRALDAAKRGRDAALDYLRRVEAASEPAEVIAGARSDYFRLRSQVEWILSDLLQTERTLRYQLGLSPTDCRLIRPVDEPTTARICFDWCEIHCEALCRSCELRQQKWRIKQKELELIASRNYLLPQLDAVALYRFLGAGEDLADFDNGRGVFPFAGSNAATTLTNGDYQEWQAGIRLNMPLGFRRELAEVRNKQLQLCREKTRLQDQELTVSHLLSDSLRLMEDWHHVMHTNYNAWIAARDRVKAIQTLIESGEKVDFLNFRQAIQDQMDAETQYFRSLTNYNKEIAHVHFRKGSLLEYNHVHLAEGPWPKKAYCDARDRARERADACVLNYGLTRPDAFSQGPICQKWHACPDPAACDAAFVEDGTLPETDPQPKPAIPNPPKAPGGQPGEQPVHHRSVQESSTPRFQSPDNTGANRAARLPSTRTRLRIVPQSNSASR